MGDPTVDVEEHEAGDRVVGPAKPAGEFAEQGDPEIRGELEPSPEVFPAEMQQGGLFHRDDVCRPGLVVEQGHFAEEASGAEHRQDDLPPILRDDAHLHLAAPDQEEGLPGIALREDQAPLGVVLLSHQLPERQQLGLRNLAEERDSAENLHRVDGHGGSEVGGGQNKGISPVLMVMPQACPGTTPPLSFMACNDLRSRTVKPNKHPMYRKIEVVCACGNKFETRTTATSIHVEVCNACHPYYTGKQRLLDTAGRVDRFRRKYGAEQAAPTPAP